MAKVEDWFFDWVSRMTELLPRADWPPIDSVYWDGLKSVLVKHGVTEAVADAAAVAMMEAPCPFPDQFAAAFVSQVKIAWATSEVIPDGLTDREAAAAAARALNGGRGCDDCGGQGFTVRYRRASLGQVDAKGRPVSPAVTFYCLCPVGRWAERNHRTGNEEARAARKRIFDLADYPALQGDEFRSPPGLSAVPVSDPMVLLRGLVDAHRLERGTGRPTVAPRRPPRPAPLDDPIIAREYQGKKEPF